MKIRELKNSEIDEIMNLWLESTIKGHDFIERKYWEKNYDIVKDVYIPMAKTFVYYDKGIQGFIAIVNDEFIGALFVSSSLQGKGIGSKLISYVKEKYDSLNLAVYKDNISAVKFYEKNGFKKLKEQSNEDTGFTEYIMSI